MASTNIIAFKHPSGILLTEQLEPSTWDPVAGPHLGSLHKSRHRATSLLFLGLVSVLNLIL